MDAMESAVKVCIRVRPLIEREESEATESSEPVQLYWKADTKSIHQIDDGTPTKSFSFDRVFGSSETTNHLYQEISKPLVVSTVEGYNGTIFAYGQTSSGKTFTMMGGDLAPGVIPLSMEEVFQTIKNFPKKEFLLRVSYMEIYNETVTDLLVDSWKRKPLEVRETLNKNIYVADLTEELVTSPSQALAWIRKGEKNRHYGKTKMNQRSSRSHTIFRMILESRERSDPASGENSDGAIIVSHLNLVDLAGSERASQTGAEGARFKEGCNINRSLFTLAQVIKKLSDESQRGFTNYRDSKLTRILQNSLGGNAKTVIICTITPATLEETLGTLQFASTAKKMKNDPHVTEVSDDGALLKRYRNEIVDLKRRLQEVSSVTQTTVTEKETLSQLLQEKDQLQKEQEDRIKNLTKLLVTGSTVIPLKKMPKRRVTWGGDRLRLAETTECHVGHSDLSFAEHFSRKRKADHSPMELLEEDEEFDEVSYEMDLNQTGSVTGRSYGDSPPVSLSGSGEKEAKHELQLERSRREEALSRASSLELQLEEERSQKEEVLSRASSLELQLEEERSQKEEVLSRASSLELQLEEERSQREEVLSRASSLELQLEEERSQKEEVLSRASSLKQQVEVLAREEVERTELRAEEQEVQLSAQEKQEKVEMLEMRLADLEEQSHTMAGSHEQTKKEFEEAVQLCETLVSEKEMVSTQRDRLQQEVLLLLEQVSSLEKERGFLSQELQERKEEEEFKSLEDNCSKEEMRESWEVKYQDLETQLGSVSEQLVKKSSRVEELEMLQGKDLVQQVTGLQRSLDDAEVLSRDTRKEWAELRSQNLTLKDRDAELSSSHEQMVVEMSRLRSQLEQEKQRSRSMQSDLQKELHVAFQENTKVTALLDGKVPKNLLESVQLEGTIAALNEELVTCREAQSELNKELTVCREVESALREELKTAPEQLTAQLSSLERQRSSLEGQLSGLQEEKERLQQEKERLQQEKERLQQEKERLQQEKEGLQQEKEGLQQEKEGLQQEKEGLQQKVSHSELSRSTEEEINRELQEQLKLVSAELESVRSERDGQCSISWPEEVERLVSEVSALSQEREQLREERNQLKMDLGENVEMMIENQDELRAALEKICEQKAQIKRLESLPTANQNASALDSAQIEDLQNHLEGTITALKEELAARQEAESELMKVESNLREELKVCREVESNLREQLRVCREAESELNKELTVCREAVSELMEVESNLREELRVCQEAESALREELKTAPEQLTAQLSGSEQQRSSLEGQLSSLQKEKESLQQEKEGLKQEKEGLKQEKEGLQQEKEGLQQEKERLQQEKERLQQEKEGLQQEKEGLQQKIQGLQQEKEGLQQKIEGLQQEKEGLQQEKEGLQQKIEGLQQEKEGLQQEKIEGLQLKMEGLQQEMEGLQQEMEGLKQEKEGLKQEKDGLQQEKEGLQQEKEGLQQKIEGLQQEKEGLQQEKEGLQQEKEGLQQEKEVLQQEKEVLQQKIEGLQQEKEGLQQKIEGLQQEKEGLQQEKEGLQQKIEGLQQEKEGLQQEKEGLQQEKEGLQQEKEVLQQEKEVLQQKIEGLQQEKEGLQQEKEGLQQEKEGLQQEKEVLQQEKEVLQQKIEGLQQEKEGLQQEKEVLQQKIEGLQQEKEGLQQRISHRELSRSHVIATATPEDLSSRLKDTTRRLKESAESFQLFISRCSSHSVAPLDKTLTEICAVRGQHHSSFPEAFLKLYNQIIRQNIQAIRGLGGTTKLLKCYAFDYRRRVEELVHSDLAVLEQRRLQDLLLSSAVAPDDDLHALWEHRLTGLLDCRELHLQRMSSMLEVLEERWRSVPGSLDAQLGEMSLFLEGVRAVCSHTPLDLHTLEDLLTAELKRSSTTALLNNNTVQALLGPQREVLEELEVLGVEAAVGLEEERSKTSTLLQDLDDAPLKAEELQLLGDNQKLLLQLQNTQNQVTALRRERDELEEAQLRSTERCSNHKRTTQLLQTELQDACAQVHDKDTTIQTLRDKLRLSEEVQAPSVAEELRDKVVKLEVEVTSATNRHQEEVRRLTSLLSIKEESLRKLRETLRKCQQEQQESFLQGQDLYCKLTNPQGCSVQTSVATAPSKKRLLPSDTSHLLSSPKRFLQSPRKAPESPRKAPESPRKAPESPRKAPESPRKVLESPRKAPESPRKAPESPRKVLESPRKVPESPRKLPFPNPPTFFGSSSSAGFEKLTKNRTKQFFDNSDLGIDPNASTSVDKELWPKSPKEEELCQTQ